MKGKVYFRRYRTTTGGFGWMLFRFQGPSYFVLAIRPHEHRVIVRLLRLLVGFSWRPLRFWKKATLLAEWRATLA